MYLYGSFINQKGKEITVYIVTNGDRTDSREIGADESGLYFTDDPIEITSEVNDTFDHLLRHSASIKLLTTNFLPDLFCPSARDAVVNIYQDGKCIFAGFIEPQTYSQPYNEVYDEIEINCIDVLSALQYSNYRNIGTRGNSYNVVKATAAERSFYNIVTEILGGIMSDIDIVGNSSVSYLYDGSKAIDSQPTNRYSIFEQLSISELLFLGDEEDDVWQQDEVVEEIMRYLNLHVVQEGFTLYIFSWETAKQQGTILWRDITSASASSTEQQLVEITNDNAADTDTTISIGEVYNQLLLTCKIESISNVIESPLDSDSLSSPFANKQLYCTEFSSDGEGEKAFRAFKAMCKDQPTTYGAGRITDWYVQVQANSQWTFPMNGNTSADLISQFSASKTNQHALPDWLGANRGAALLSIGSVEKNTAKDDNSPTSKVTMSDYLVVSVNGNGQDGETAYRPNDTDLKANIPCAVYNGNTAGGNFSPADDETTNYIVLSGSVALNPLMEMTDAYKALHNGTDTDWAKQLSGGWWNKTVPSRDNEDGRYYTRKYWKAENPNDTATWNTATDYGFIPFTGKGPEQYEFKYSAVGDGTDTISKVSVLACMLIIGGKCVVETGTQGQVTDFQWKTYKTREQCSSDDEYYQQCFYIGFDPKISDKLIGTEFSIQNNINYTMGIDAEGIAIPIKKADKVSGQVKFMILGPVNTIWGDITRRHPTFFRHTKWTTNAIPLLAHVSNILVKQFEVKVYSDNGLVNNTGDNDIIYMSDTLEKFTNKKDDLEFKINSALTTAEYQALGVAGTVNMSTPMNTVADEGLLSIYDYGKATQAKPEQLYVDSYYTEYHESRVLMEQKLTDDDTISLFNHFRHPAISKSFFVQGISRNLMEGYAALTLKEIES